MNGASRLRFAGVDQHIDAGCVTIFDADRLNGRDDGLQVVAIDGDVDTPRRTRPERTAFVAAEKQREAADAAILDARLSERARKPIDRIEELLHVSIVRRDGRHEYRRRYWEGGLSSRRNSAR